MQCHSERSVSGVKNLKQIAGDSSHTFGMTFACHSEVWSTEKSHPQAYVMLSDSEASPCYMEDEPFAELMTLNRNNGIGRVCRAVCQKSVSVMGDFISENNYA